MTSTEFQNLHLRGNVGVHEQQCRRVRQINRGRGRQGEKFKGQICLPAGVDHERLLQPEEALQHHEGWRGSRLQGLRGGHTHWVGFEVSYLHPGILYIQVSICLEYQAVA